MCKTCNKKRKRRTNKRGVSVAGLADINAMQMAGAAAGAVAAIKVDPMLNKIQFLADNKLIKAAAKVGLGLFLGSMDNDIVKGAGVGMVATAGAGAILGMMSGGQPVTIGAIDDPFTANRIGQLPGARMSAGAINLSGYHKSKMGTVQHMGREYNDMPAPQNATEALTVFGYEV